MKPEGSRKLIEVALPLEAINKEAAREKPIRHGHPSTLHLWWARGEEPPEEPAAVQAYITTTRRGSRWLAVEGG
ncbi:MAG TPA: DUF1156 domain-containing protein [Vicinamibacteria bacterium]|nr:DUF1156 domain-containing protein [Vicinamibacteria bacterium]